MYCRAMQGKDRDPQRMMCCGFRTLCLTPSFMSVLARRRGHVV